MNTDNESVYSRVDERLADAAADTKRVGYDMPFRPFKMRGGRRDWPSL